MMHTATYAGLCVAAFLAGSIPFGLLIARAKGIDLRTVGSRNIGATNVLRSVGKLPALFTLLADIFKGAIFVALGRHLGVGVTVEGVIGLCAVLGHIFSVFLAFKGGKGVATALGVFVIYSPGAWGVTVVTWLITAFVTRYSSLAALTAFALLPGYIYIIDRSMVKVIIGIVVTVVIFFKHRDNISRLLHGTEKKIGRKSDA
ncbi:glycerol-3-phosphate 1-O-acyltransferase PlsY [Candidatus Magnetobacterium casense]|uniref:glycerol-3-phosphate 1-O-acyltransferase PlsY n=1 Tax=Candidatus Magnetobacterium casense TaxID=1455061 RepID=UPI000AFC9158|nr:glycerol-3-phosphate 1-O-acyltransferase PlsY [Candidatus Magnetobacterium casensis]